MFKILQGFQASINNGRGEKDEKLIVVKTNFYQGTGDVCVAFVPESCREVFYSTTEVRMRKMAANKRFIIGFGKSHEIAEAEMAARVRELVPVDNDEDYVASLGIFFEFPETTEIRGVRVVEDLIKENAWVGLDTVLDLPNNEVNERKFCIFFGSTSDNKGIWAALLPGASAGATGDNLVASTGWHFLLNEPLFPGVRANTFNEAYALLKAKCATIRLTDKYHAMLCEVVWELLSHDEYTQNAQGVVDTLKSFKYE